jgi:hypothetical protein
MYDSLQHVLSLFSMLCLHQSLPGDGSQQCPLLPCSYSYRLANVSELTYCFNCPAYNIWERIVRNTPLPKVTPLLHITQPLPSNGYFSGSTVFALSKYVTIKIFLFLFWINETGLILVQTWLDIVHSDHATLSSFGLVCHSLPLQIQSEEQTESWTWGAFGILENVTQNWKVSC